MRTLAAVAWGLVVAVILIESLSAGLSVLLPDSVLYVRAVDGYGDALVWPLLPIPALIWLIGGLAGSLMTAAAAPRTISGLVVGLLLALPAGLVVGLIMPGNPLALLAALLPIAGAAAGTQMIRRLKRESVTKNGQAV